MHSLSLTVPFSPCQGRYRWPPNRDHLGLLGWHRLLHLSRAGHQDPSPGAVDSQLHGGEHYEPADHGGPHSSLQQVFPHHHGLSPARARPMAAAITSGFSLSVMSPQAAAGRHLVLAVLPLLQCHRLPGLRHRRAADQLSNRLVFYKNKALLHKNPALRLTSGRGAL